MRNIFLTLTLTFSIVNGVYSQKSMIQGIVVDTKMVPVEFASVVLMTSDSAHIEGWGAMTDSLGCFGINEPSDINVGYVFVSALGYCDTYIRIPSDRKLPVIVLPESFIQLSEVSVEAKQVLAKTNKQIILPSEVQRQSSSSGFDLLSVLPLPQVTVDRLRKTITVQGRGEAQVRINNLRATTEEVFSLRPSDVIRVEFFDMPGGQYGAEEELAVVNFIVKRREGGGYVSVNTNNGLNSRNGMNSLVAKLNYKKSSFGVSYAFPYDNTARKRYDRISMFNFPTYSVTRNSVGIDRKVISYNNDFQLSYNLASQDSYMFNVVFKGELLHLDNYPTSIISYLGDESSQTYSESSQYFRTRSYSLDVYYEKKLLNNQKLFANIVGNRNGNDYDRWFKETGEAGLDYDYRSIIDGYRYSIIGNMVYEKSWGENLLDIGGRFSYGYAHNEYKGTNRYSDIIKNNSLYLYAQFTGKLGQLSYNINLGGYRYFYDISEGIFDFYHFRGDLGVTYPIGTLGSVGYRFVSRPVTPMISQLSGASQEDDRFQVRFGNPRLRPYREYMNQFNLNMKVKHLSFAFSPFFEINDNPIMGETQAIDDKILIVPENQREFTRYGIAIDLSLPLFDKFLVLRGSGEMAVNRSEGADYTHRLTTWYGTIQALFTYRNWNLILSAHNRSVTLWGETIAKGAKGQLVELDYTYKAIKVGIGVDSPFEKEWNKITQIVSSINPSKEWMRTSGSQVIYLNLSWDFTFGKKSRSHLRKLNNRDTDGGALF